MHHSCPYCRSDFSLGTKSQHPTLRAYPESDEAFIQYTIVAETLMRELLHVCGVSPRNGQVEGTGGEEQKINVK